MVEKKKGDVYLAFLDRILSGEEDVGPVEDAEIAKLLELAKSLVAADFSVNSEIRENLRKKLLAQVANQNKSPLTMLSENDDELDEEALDHVNAAGIAGANEKQTESCPYCGARVIKLDGTCYVCGR